MPRVSKTKKYDVIRNPKLMEAARGFVPVFGNSDDLSLFDRILDFEKLLASVDNEVLRNPGKKALTKKMQEILTEERNLIFAITNRNNDF